jgi:hypothetical protein
MTANMARMFLAGSTNNRTAERWEMYETAVEAYSELKESSSTLEWLQKWEAEFP